MRGEIVFIMYDNCQNIEKPNNLEVVMSKVKPNGRNRITEIYQCYLFLVQINSNNNYLVSYLGTVNNNKYIR